MCRSLALESLWGWDGKQPSKYLNYFTQHYFSLNFQIYKWNSCIICTQKPLPLVEMIRFHRCVKQQVNWVDKGFWDQGTNGLVFLHSLISICVERATKTPYCLNYKAMQINTSIQMFVVSMFFFFGKNWILLFRKDDQNSEYFYIVAKKKFYFK